VFPVVKSGPDHLPRAVIAWMVRLKEEMRLTAQDTKTTDPY
jgi:hypothetical protein